MSNKEQSHLEEAEEAVKSFDAKAFFEENKKPFLYGAGAIVLLIMGYFGYKEFIMKPKEQEGLTAIRQVQKFYGEDSLQHVINGHAGVPSAAELADEYSGTKAADLANYMAGTAYLQKGDFESAIEYLEKVSFDDLVMQYQCMGALGDAYVETGELEKGLKLYKEAGTNLEDQLAKRWWLKAGLVMEKLELWEDAIAWYEDGKEKLRGLPEQNDMDMYIERVKSKQNN